MRRTAVELDPTVSVFLLYTFCVPFSVTLSHGGRTGHRSGRARPAAHLCSPQEKKMVASYVIKAVTLTRNYGIQVEFNIS